MKTLLVANRGEIARRIFRTARLMGLHTVAVYSDADADAPHVAEADAAVRLPGVTPGDTYLRGDLIVAAGQQAGADAVHPGYGFLSENADFARSVEAAGLTWVGPPPAAIAAMGSKLEAKAAMAAAGVPTLPWTDDPAQAGAIGFPLLVKASAGGGGRGMRVVEGESSLAAAVDSARREAASAFGDATVFCEKYLPAPRHVEIQVFADTHGNVVSLHERECSIQRRHQKIVEESPSPAVDAELRARMGEAGIAAARAVGYLGAGTVEFVVDADGSYYFLEMNTRLQVEHPVTEAVTGLDLVRLQLMVADGEPLPDEALRPPMRGHAIEVRLYAEDAARDYLPTTGTLRAFELSDGVRVDSGVETGSTVSPYYDAMLAKVVAHAPTRREAAAALAGALRRSRIHGVTTNRDLLVGILTEPDFLAGETTTSYLERHDPVALAATATDDVHGQVVAAVLALRHRHRATAQVLGGLPAGWRNNPAVPQHVEFEHAGGHVSVDYLDGRDGLRIDIGQELHPAVQLHHCDDTTVDVTVDGIRRRYAVSVTADGAHVDVDAVTGSGSFTVVPRFVDPTAQAGAGALVAPMPGSVVRLMVSVGDVVEAGSAVLAIEAMKMEHTVSAPTTGTVSEIRVEVGQQVDAGTVLAVVDDPAAPTSEESA